MSMLILKFGGTSLGDVAAMGRAHGIVRERLHQRPVIVVSALSGVTDSLLDVCEKAGSTPVSLKALRHRHDSLAQSLGVTSSIFDRHFRALSRLMEGIRMVGEVSDRARDQVAAFGERLSCALFVAYLSRRGIPSRQWDADSLGVITDSRHGCARPLPGIDQEIRRRLISERLVPVVTGFIGRDVEGHVTTLGRHGSDYTASLLGRALRATEIQIWTDVDGIMTADPRLVPDARPLGRVTFGQACELARSGARVLHPASLQPAIEGRIPVRVQNARHPEGAGTLVLDEEEPGAPAVPIAIVQRRDLQLVRIDSPFSESHDECLAPILEACRRHRISVQHIASSACSLSLVVSGGDVTSWSSEIAPLIQSVSRRDVARLAVISRRQGLTWERVQPALEGLIQQTIPLELLSLNAEGTYMGILVPAKLVEPAVRELHRALIGPLTYASSNPSKNRSDESSPSRNS